MKFGYIRVSTLSQDFYRQQMELLNNGVLQENIYEEKMSGTKKAITRPAFEEMVEKLQPNDECIFESMSRMARSMQDLIDTTNFLVKKKQVKVMFIKENLTVGGNDGSESAMSALVFNIMGSFAQFERDLIADRTKQGIKARRELLGEKFKIGRPKTISKDKVCEVLKLYSKGKTYNTIMAETGVSKSSISRILKRKENKNEIL